MNVARVADGAPGGSAQLIALAVGLAYSRLPFEHGVAELTASGNAASLTLAAHQLVDWGELPPEVAGRASVLLWTARTTVLGATDAAEA